MVIVRDLKSIRKAKSKIKESILVRKIAIIH